MVIFKLNIDLKIYENIGHGPFEMTWQRTIDCRFNVAVTKLMY